MSQLILGIVALILAIRPARVATLEKKSGWKWGIPIVVSVIAITGFLQSVSSDSEFKRQIRTLYASNSLQATKDDIGSLAKHIDSGFQSVVDAIRELCTTKPVKPPVIKPHEGLPIAALPAPPHTTWTQARTLSPTPPLYAIQLTIQSDQPIPVSFAIECTGPVEDVKAFLVGQGAYMGVALGHLDNPNIALVKIGFPNLTPQTPLVVTILSKQDIRVIGVSPYQQ